jgi:hypothetical protein
MMAPVLLLLVVLAIALMAPAFGADSRDGRDWQPPRGGTSGR